MSPPRMDYFRFLTVRRLMALVLVVLPLALLVEACGDSTTAPPTAPSTPPPQGPADMQITDLVVGDGDEQQPGLQGTYIYSVWNYDPAGADSSKGSAVALGATIQLRPGITSLIAGVTQGVVGMKVHGKRRLIIPPSLAYGATGSSDGRIPPNAWVVFEFELLDVRDCAVSVCQS
jgi:FKBP-type peptidyl-prolyl cis-trans isomerase FkpA